ncbi:hypothetical protein DSO57_1005202 [Entomophthora muscae]|uniref:Uncharacterized protein n=1 Tax=Entomophthora muscae TaxID=34485 RepID=A0ACC2T7N4_9FUNG|nr:hypothetical protein DSO57_1005202 [Entomophthora muscae]
MQSAKLWCSSVKDSLLSFIYPTPEDNEVTFDARLSPPTVVCLEESASEANVNCKPSFNFSNESQPIHLDQTSQVLPENYILQTYPATEEKEASFDAALSSPTVVCLNESASEVNVDYKASFDSSNESMPIHQNQTSQVLPEKHVLQTYPSPEEKEASLDATLSFPTVICLKEGASEANVNCKPSFDFSNESQPIHLDQTSQVLPENHVFQTYPSSEEKEASFDFKFGPPTVVRLEESVFKAYDKSSFNSSIESLPINPDQASQVLSKKPVLKSCLCYNVSAPTIDLSLTVLKPSSSKYFCKQASVITESLNSLEPSSSTSVGSTTIFARTIAHSYTRLKSSFSQSICTSSISLKKICKQTRDSFESYSVLPESPLPKKYSNSVRMLLFLRLITQKNIQENLKNIVT